MLQHFVPLGAPVPGEETKASGSVSTQHRRDCAPVKAVGTELERNPAYLVVWNSGGCCVGPHRETSLHAGVAIWNVLGILFLPPIFFLCVCSGCLCVLCEHRYT